MRIKSFFKFLKLAVTVAVHLCRRANDREYMVFSDRLIMGAGQKMTCPEVKKLTLAVLVVWIFHGVLGGVFTPSPVYLDS